MTSDDCRGVTRTIDTFSYGSRGFATRVFMLYYGETDNGSQTSIFNKRSRDRLVAGGETTGEGTDDPAARATERYIESVAAAVTTLLKRYIRVVTALLLLESFAVTSDGDEDDGGEEEKEKQRGRVYIRVIRRRHNRGNCRHEKD